MNQTLLNIFYGFKIKMLLVFSPAVFFQKINQLDWYKATLHQWISQHQFLKGSKVLDVGCATGSLTQYLAQSHFEAIGVDYSKKMINAARVANPNIDFYIADVTALPFKNEVFNSVVSSSLLNVVSEKQKMINEMSRVCKSGGIISILVPANNFENENFIELKNELNISNFSNAALAAWHKYAAKMSPEDVEQLFIAAELNISSTIYYLNGMVFSISATKIITDKAEHNPDIHSDP